jgi:hypothetical protein
MNSILVGVFVALAVWIFIKLRKSNSGLFKSLRPAAVRPSSQPQPEKREMPRIGVPGTITDEQFKALKRNLFEPSKDWSFEEAALILDAATYLRAVCAEVAGKREPPLQIQNELLAFILHDQDLRDYVLKWGKNRREAGIQNRAPKLKRNDQFQRVARAATKLVNG